MSADNPKCETCRWFDRRLSETSDMQKPDGLGVCKVRSHPTPDKTKDDFCGEHSSASLLSVIEVPGWKPIPGSAGAMVKEAECTHEWQVHYNEGFATKAECSKCGEKELAHKVVK